MFEAVSSIFLDRQLLSIVSKSCLPWRCNSLEPIMITVGFGRQLWFAERRWLGHHLIRFVSPHVKGCVIVCVLISMPTLSKGVLRSFTIIIHEDCLLFLKRNDIAGLLTSSQSCCIFHRIIILLKFVEVIFYLDIHTKMVHSFQL